MKKQNLGNLGVALLVALNILFWLLFAPPPSEEYSRYAEQVFGEVLSSSAVILFACALLLSNKPRMLEPYFGGFLYTHVDREGLLQGTDMAAIRAVRAATAREVIAAGGITTMEEVDELHAMGVDAVVGMALYTGRLALPPRP